MKRNLLYCILLILVLGIGIFYFYRNSEQRQGKIKSGKERIEQSSDVRSIFEVSKNAKKDLENAKKTSKKLKFDDITPYCPDVDSVFDFRAYDRGCYKDIDNEKEMLKEEISFIERMLGKKWSELDKADMESGYFNIANKGKYKSFQEFFEDDEENEKREPEWLAYMNQTEEKMEYAEITHPSFDTVAYVRGKCYELAYEKRMSDEDGNTMRTQPRFVCDLVAEYYVYGDESKLEDKWKLLDGELSVKEGIEFTEKYLDELLTLDGENEDVKLKVAYVKVYELKDGVYTFRYKIRREIGGLLCQSVDNGASIPVMNMNYDMNDAYQVEKNSIDMYDGMTKLLNYEKLNESSKILPLAKAIDLLEENLGDNSTYEVQSVELGYLNLWKDYMIQDQEDATACWCFRCINEQDKMITEFYVNALTGGIETYVRHD